MLDVSPAAAPVKRGLLARIDDWFRQRQRHDVETYLASSQNVSELEERMRALDRVESRPYY